VSTRVVGILSLITLLLVALWAALLLWSIARGDAVASFEQALAYARNCDWVYTLVYLNATLFTLAATMLFGALYAHYRAAGPGWAAAGVILVPVYGGLNLFAYFSQISLVPALAGWPVRAEYAAARDLLLAQMVQLWAGSAVGIVNSLAYAILGIPSIIYGAFLYREGGLRRAAGGLLASSGVASLVGLLGYAGGDGRLGLGTVGGGFLFLLALLPLTAAFLGRNKAGAGGD
jgi:hypothetical protein